MPALCIQARQAAERSVGGGHLILTPGCLQRAGQVMEESAPAPRGHAAYIASQVQMPRAVCAGRRARPRRMLRPCPLQHAAERARRTRLQPCLPGRHRRSHGGAGLRPARVAEQTAGSACCANHPPPRPACSPGMHLSCAQGCGAAALQSCGLRSPDSRADCRGRQHAGPRAVGRHIPAICRPAAPPMPVLQRACNDARRHSSCRRKCGTSGAAGARRPATAPSLRPHRGARSFCA